MNYRSLPPPGFQWDENKNRQNIKDHGISFWDAVHGDIRIISARVANAHERRLYIEQALDLVNHPEMAQANPQRTTKPTEHKPEQKRESTAERLARQVRESEIKLTFEQSRKLKP